MNSQCAQGIQHVAYIVAISRLVSTVSATIKSRQQQGTIRTLLDPGGLIVPSTRAMGCNVEGFQ